MGDATSAAAGSAPSPSIATGEDDLPPIDDDILAGAPPTTWHDFKHAKLRRFRGHAEKIKWLDYLGHGAEGIVFKVAIGDDDPVALKIVPDISLPLAPTAPRPPANPPSSGGGNDLPQGSGL